MTDPVNPAVSAKVPRGAILTTAYAEREVKVLAVLDNEVHSISTFNTLTTAFVSAGTSLISIAIGIWANGAFADKLTPEGTVLSHFGAPLLCALGLLMYYLASWAYRTRQSTLDAIKVESKSKAEPS
jgi:hypothetical protein